MDGVQQPQSDIAFPSTNNPVSTTQPDTSAMHKNPNAPLRLLSLDGGGVRGLSSLIILDTLMRSIAKEEKRLRIRSEDDNTPLRPCDYFDLIGGTSTGGIIAVLLGRLRLNCEECIKIYTELAQQIFRRDRSIRIAGMKLPTGPTRFSGAVLEQHIKGVLKQLGRSENELMWDASIFEEMTPESTRRNSLWTGPERLRESPVEMRKTPVLENITNTSSSTIVEKANQAVKGLENMSPLQKKFVPSTERKRKPTFQILPHNSVHKKLDQSGCRVFVVSVSKHALGLPRLLCTYDPNDKATKIWEALRATSAAPTFFEEMVMGNPKTTYLDGGVGFNNPCAEVDSTAKALWPDRCVGLICSIGTGLQTIPSVKNGMWLPFGLGTDLSLASALASMATSTQRVDNEMTRQYYGSATRYYRFDVDNGMAGISLEDWMRESEMVGLTRAYLEDPQQREHSRLMAECIVKLTQVPPVFTIDPRDFSVGITGSDIVDGSFTLDKLDFKTGYPLGVTVTTADIAHEAQIRQRSPMGRGGLALDTNGRLTEVFPVQADLDHDGRKEEAVVLTCARSDNVCIRMVKHGIPQGKYMVKFIVCFYDTEHTAPVDLIFSVGQPYNPTTFAKRYVDVYITPEIGPMLLEPDAVRVRVGPQRYAEKNGKGWVEIEADDVIEVGLEGVLGIMINKRFVEGEFVGGWSFGGIKVIPAGFT